MNVKPETLFQACHSQNCFWTVLMMQLFPFGGCHLLSVQKVDQSLHHHHLVNGWQRHAASLDDLPNNLKYGRHEPCCSHLRNPVHCRRSKLPCHLEFLQANLCHRLSCLCLCRHLSFHLGLFHHLSCRIFVVAAQISTILLVDW